MWSASGVLPVMSMETISSALLFSRLARMAASSVGAAPSV